MQFTASSFNEKTTTVQFMNVILTHIYSEVPNTEQTRIGQLLLVHFHTHSVYSQAASQR